MIQIVIYFLINFHEVLYETFKSSIGLEMKNYFYKMQLLQKKIYLYEQIRNKTVNFINYVVALRL